jgi:spermidine synthase
MVRSDRFEGHPGGPYLPALLLMFVGSGCAALIYEIVWFQLLRQVIGASAISLGILLSSYMGGLFLGSLAFPKYVSMRHHPLKAYAVLELGIGACGILMLAVLPLVRLIYVGVVGYGLAGILLRAFVCLLLLLPPTILMGATLPAIARYMETTRVGISRIGLLYTANICGAVAGCLLAGFYLLRVYDMLVATFFAAAINAVIAGVSLLIAAKGKQFEAPEGEVQTAAATGATNPWVYVVIGVSGFTALGAQVVWTRLISLLFGGTVYTFSIILAVFLIGLALGSGAGSLLAQRVRRPGAALGWTQLLLVVAIPVGAFMISREIPFWYLNPDFYSDILLRYGHDLLRATVAMLFATFLWGASFPLALAAVGRPGEDPGSLVGRVYAANTVGAILGSAAFSMFMIPAFGTQQSQQRLTLLAGLAAVSMFMSDRLVSGGDGAPPSGEDAVGPSLLERAGGVAGAVRLAGATALILLLTAVMVRSVTPVPNGLVAYGRFIEDWDMVEAYHYVGEGMNTSVAVSDWPEEGVRSFHVGGKVVASTRRVDMRLQRMLGHLPALFQGGPKSVLVVGFGAGVTAGSFVVHEELERIVICEIEPLVPEAAAEWLGPENFYIKDDPRAELIFDDARHFIATTDEKFDVITSDPIHPWVSGSAALYSAEYYELVKQRLNPGGVVAQWLPLYETSEEAVKSSLATFMEAFPHGTVWNSDIFGEGYDVVMIGSVEPLTVDIVAVEDQLARNPALRQSLAAVDFHSGMELLTSYVGQASDLQRYLVGAQLNRDRSLRLQYLAGLALDENDSVPIFQAMSQYRSYPENLFVVPPYMEAQLRQAFEYGGVR